MMSLPKYGHGHNESDLGLCICVHALVLHSTDARKTQRVRIRGSEGALNNHSPQPPLEEEVSEIQAKTSDDIARLQAQNERN